MKLLEIQLEESYEERQQALKEKRNLERMAQSISEKCPQKDKGFFDLIKFHFVLKLFMLIIM